MVTLGSLGSPVVDSTGWAGGIVLDAATLTSGCPWSVVEAARVIVVDSTGETVVPSELGLASSGVVLVGLS